MKPFYRDSEGGLFFICRKEEKKTKTKILISGCDIGSLKKGKGATVINEQGKYLFTSPVVDYIVAGGYVCIETQNTVYVTK
jgi:hypothetical protein